MEEKIKKYRKVLYFFIFYDIIRIYVCAAAVLLEEWLWRRK